MKIEFDEFEIEIRPKQTEKSLLESLHDILSLPVVEKAMKILVTISEGIALKETETNDFNDRAEVATQSIIAAFEANPDLTFEQAVDLVADFDLSERDVKGIYEAAKTFIDVLGNVETEDKAKTNSV